MFVFVLCIFCLCVILQNKIRKNVKQSLVIFKRTISAMSPGQAGGEEGWVGWRNNSSQITFTVVSQWEHMAENKICCSH